MDERFAELGADDGDGLRQPGLIFHGRDVEGVETQFPFSSEPVISTTSKKTQAGKSSRKTKPAHHGKK
jgi:hypothetical protein